MKKLFFILTLLLCINSYGQKPSVSIGTGYYSKNFNTYMDFRQGRVNHLGTMLKYDATDDNIGQDNFAISVYYLIPYDDDMSYGFSLPIGFGYEYYNDLMGVEDGNIYFHVGLIKFFYLTSKLGLEVRADYTTTHINRFSYSIGIRF